MRRPRPWPPASTQRAIATRAIAKHEVETHQRKSGRRVRARETLRVRHRIRPIGEQGDIRTVTAESGEVPRTVDVGDGLEAADDQRGEQHRQQYEAGLSTPYDARAQPRTTAPRDTNAAAATPRTNPRPPVCSSPRAHHSPLPAPSQVPVLYVEVPLAGNYPVEREDLQHAKGNSEGKQGPPEMQAPEFRGCRTVAAPDRSQLGLWEVED